MRGSYRKHSKGIKMFALEAAQVGVTPVLHELLKEVNMDVEAALLENSPTLSTISSDCTDTTYSGPDSPYSPESPIIVISSYKKTKDDEVTPRPTPRHPLPPRKPNFRIRPPYLMICISIIEIAVHCLGDEATLRRWLVYDPRQRVQGWRFASYMLLHSNALHLALNVVIQLVLATPLEVEQGRIGVATIYLGGGVCGALGASLLQPSLFLVGASAGVYALLTSHLAHLYLCHGELRYASWRLGAVLLLASADVASLPIPALLGCGRVGWAAHVAGALAGPLLGLAVFPNQSKKDARGRRFVSSGSHPDRGSNCSSSSADGPSSSSRSGRPPRAFSSRSPLQSLGNGNFCEVTWTWGENYRGESWNRVKPWREERFGDVRDWGPRKRWEFIELEGGKGLRDVTDRARGSCCMYHWMQIGWK
ncbi:Protein rhomboid [Eufriesea mexicana]|uniref:Protein rhomboid n=1 Tax=Eufriesea mexicana TaxID=516756 RepID=A0A310SAN6_9HYME|nr:Protein rhomboid [Eufriesea mexicana]